MSDVLARIAVAVGSWFSATLDNSLKRVALILVLVIVLIILWKLPSCDRGEPRRPDVEALMTSPVDSGFVPIQTRNVRPVVPLTRHSFGRPLPRNVKPADVTRTIDVITQHAGTRDTVSITETRAGDVVIPADSTIIGVTVTEFATPLFQPQVQVGLGVSFSFSNNRVVPVATLSPLLIANTIAPVAAVDPRGIGVGITARLYYDVYGGAAYVWQWDNTRALNALLVYTF